MANLKVMMIGGRRCGKTSALASMFHEMNNSIEIMELLNANDQTILEEKVTDDGIVEKQESLINKITELRYFFTINKNSEFLIDKGPTRFPWLYYMQIILSGTAKAMKMEFCDSPGESFDFGGEHTEETKQYIMDCDVFVVVIDTPYLMHENQAVREAANIPGYVNSFISNMDAGGGTLAPKCVLFVPNKCEKWLHEGKISEVVDAIKENYRPTIEYLSTRPNTEVVIIPIETAGDIEFSEMRDAYIVANENGIIIRGSNGKPKKYDYDNKHIKCSLITKRTVMLPDGRMYSLQQGDVVQEDSKSVFKFDKEEMDIPRPVSWFKFPENKQFEYTPSYKPKNCEQVCLHILRFMLNKARKGQSTNSIMQWFRGIFGLITIDDLNNTIVELTNRGLIKENVDGIIRLKTYY